MNIMLELAKILGLNGSLKSTRKDLRRPSGQNTKTILKIHASNCVLPPKSIRVSNQVVNKEQWPPSSANQSATSSQELVQDAEKSALYHVECAIQHVRDCVMVPGNYAQVTSASMALLPLLLTFHPSSLLCRDLEESLDVQGLAGYS